MRTSLAAMAVLGAACGRIGFGDVAPAGDDARRIDGDAPMTTFVPSWQSGTRIRARLAVGVDGGDPHFIGWRDTQLDTDCFSARAADGIERCIPREARADKYFADAGCATTPIAVIPASRRCGRDRLAFRYEGNNARVFAFGAAHTGPIYDANNGCQIASNVGEAYLVGAEIPPAMFARTVYENVQIGALIQVRYGFDDGSYALGTTLNRPGDGRQCAPGLQPPGPAACVTSEDRIVEPVFSDAACTTRAFFYDASSATEADLQTMRVEHPRPCDTAATAYDVTSSLAQTTYYARAGGACVARTRAAEDRLYTGIERSEGFPDGTMAVTTGPARIGSLVWLGPDGVRMPYGPFDRDLAMPCRHFVAPDGLLRCLPRAPKTIVASADATCGAPQPLAAGCYGGPPLDGPDYGSCDDRWSSVVAYSTQVQAAYVDGDTSCMEIEMPGGAFQPPSGGSGALPPTSFPEMMEIVE